MNDALIRVFAWMRELHDELALPGLSVGTFMKSPSLDLRGQSIIGSKDGEVLVVHCPVEIKELLIEAAPETYFETAHYKGYPAILMRPECVEKDELRRRIEMAWELTATKRQIAERDARRD